MSVFREIKPEWRPIETELYPLVYRTCPQCFVYFTVTPSQEGRRNRKWCSNSCRTASYKRRVQIKAAAALAARWYPKITGVTAEE